MFFADIWATPSGVVASRVPPLTPSRDVTVEVIKLSFENVVLESNSFATSGANTAVVENAVSSE